MEGLRGNNRDEARQVYSESTPRPALQSSPSAPHIQGRRSMDRYADRNENPVPVVRPYSGPRRADARQRNTEPTSQGRTSSRDIKGVSPSLVRACRTVVLATMLWTIGLAAAWAQAQAPLHDSQYSDADIAYGATLYTSKCVTCHGTQGDAHRRRQPAQRHVPERRHRSRPRALHQSRLAGRHARRSRWTTPRWRASSPTFAT